MSDEPPVVRTLRILAMIQARPGIDAATLATRLEMSDRAVRRHVDALRQAGLAVNSTPGRGGGYRLARGIRPPLLFTQEELVGLTMALSELPGGMADESARSAAVKILAALPARVASAAQGVLGTAVSMPARGTSRPAPAQVLELVRAIDEARVVKMSYRPAEAEAAGDRVAEPWALLIRHHRWYLLALNCETRSTRTYRVDRISDVQITEQHFQRPANLDPTKEFEHHLQASWTHPTEVDIQASIADATPWIPFTMGELSPLTADTCRLVGRTNNCKAYLLDLARTPHDFIVIGGDDLRVAAQRLLAGVSVRDDTRADMPDQAPNGTVNPARPR